MFETFFSLGSLLAITVSLTLTVKSFKINSIKNSNVNSPDITGNNNQVIINQLVTKETSDFKQLSNLIVIVLLILFPIFPSFFIKFLSTFSFCAVMICIVGVFKNIQQKGCYAVYGLVYIPITALIGVLSISAIYSSHYGGYIFTEFYPRFFHKVKLFSISSDYLTSMENLFLEGTAYIGLATLFASLIHACFGFLRNRNFDETVKFSKCWVPLSIVGHFLASGGLIALSYGNTQYIISMYENILINLSPVF